MLSARQSNCMKERSSIIVACSMLEDEVQLIMREEGIQTPVHWMERGLHQVPEQLRDKLQTLIGELEKEYDDIVLCYGQCGSALNGLVSSRSRLVAMRCDDCIRMLLPDGVEKRNLYFTGGWMRSNQFIGNEYVECLLKYGENKTKRIYDVIVGQYRELSLVETGAYNMDTYVEQAQKTAQDLALGFGSVTGSLDILRKLLTQRWDEDIAIADPGHTFDWLPCEE